MPQGRPGEYCKHCGGKIAFMEIDIVGDKKYHKKCVAEMLNGLAKERERQEKESQPGSPW